MRKNHTGIELSGDEFVNNPACPFHPAQNIEWTDSAYQCSAVRIALKPGLDYIRIQLGTKGHLPWRLNWQNDRLLLGFVESNWAKVHSTNDDIEKLEAGNWFRASGTQLSIDRCSSKQVQLHLVLCSRDTTRQLIELDPENQHPALHQFADNNQHINLRSGQMNPDANSIAKQITQLKSNTLRDRLKIEANLLNWIAETLHQSATAAAAANSTINAHDRDAIGRITQAMREAPGEEYSLQELCEIGHINEHKLKSAFKSIHGKTAFSYLREVRMHYAAELLQADRLSVIQVANEVGYSNASHFARAFKEQHQLLPKAYQCLHRLKP